MAFDMLFNIFVLDGNGVRSRLMRVLLVKIPEAVKQRESEQKICAIHLKALTMTARTKSLENKQGTTRTECISATCLGNHYKLYVAGFKQHLRLVFTKSLLCSACSSRTPTSILLPPSFRPQLLLPRLTTQLRRKCRRAGQHGSAGNGGLWWEYPSHWWLVDGIWYGRVRG